MLERYKYEIPQSEQMYNDLKYYQDLYNSRKRKTPDEKYEEIISLHYKFENMWFLKNEQGQEDVYISVNHTRP